MSSKKSAKSRIKKVDLNSFDFYARSNELSQSDTKNVNRLRNNVNKQIRRAYADNPDNPAFDDLRQAIFILTGKEPIDMPTIPSIKDLDAQKANDLLDIISFSQAEFYKTGYGNKGISTFFTNLQEERKRAGLEPLDEKEKYKFANIFRSDQWVKLKERSDLGSGQTKNEVEKLVESSVNFSSSEIIGLLDEFIKSGNDNLVGFVDEAIYKREHRKDAR